MTDPIRVLLVDDQDLFREGCGSSSTPRRA